MLLKEMEVEFAREGEREREREICILETKCIKLPQAYNTTKC